jgi:hypothetical protein
MKKSTLLARRIKKSTNINFAFYQSAYYNAGMCRECDIQIAYHRHLWRLLEHKWSTDDPPPDLKYISGPGPDVHLTEDEYRKLRHQTKS